VNGDSHRARAAGRQHKVLTSAALVPGGEHFIVEAQQVDRVERAAQFLAHRALHGLAASPLRNLP